MSSPFEDPRSKPRPTLGPDDNRTGIDLGEEMNAAGLEDTQMVEHMAAARRRLAEHEERMAQIPQLAPLIVSKVEVFGMLATVVKAVPDERCKQGTAADHVSIQARRMGNLLNGTVASDMDGTVEELAEAPALRNYLQQVQKELCRAGDALQAHHLYLKDLNSQLSKARIAIIDVCEKLQRRCEYLDKEREFHRELLRSASQVYDARSIKLSRDVAALAPKRQPPAADKQPPTDSE